jgi:predicted nuclease of restriction endonuclease-like (RecB) superfamily
MTQRANKKIVVKSFVAGDPYNGLLHSVGELLEQARRLSARSVNTILTTTYWEIGRRIVEFEQHGKGRAGYGEGLLQQLARDLTKNYGRGFSVDNLESMRLFYLAYPEQAISDTVSRISSSPISETVSRKSDSILPDNRFPLSWSHYVMFVRRVQTSEARAFYEAEAIRGGWSVRQLDRQISTQFYERTALSKNKAGMLKKGERAAKGEPPTAEEELKDPYVLEFLGLKDEYSENDLEEALIQHLERFLLELGGDFAFIGRQKRLRIGNEWYRVDLLFFHRKLKCLVVIDLKVGKFTHADAGQMHMYLNYAREHWVNDGENPPVGLILCAEKDSAVAKYALEGLPNKIMASEYKLALPDEKKLVKELQETRKKLLVKAKK